MQILRRLPLDAKNFHGGTITVGNYDGLHLGHQCLLARLQAQGGPRIVVTFDPHPTQVLRPEHQLKRLFPRADLAERLPDFGVDLLLVLPFDREFARLSAEEFLNQFVGVLKPRHFVAGYDFAFGTGREGTLDVLRLWALAQNVAIDVVEPLRIEGDIVSSRRIRELVLRGEVRAAARLLGRPFYLRGEVVAGAGRGVQLGVPTLNQKVENETFPALGVYASRVRIAENSYASVTNIGINPTFAESSVVKVETHVLGVNGDWRGQTVDVELIERLRAEQKFSSVEDLKKQLQRDILKAKDILGGK